MADASSPYLNDAGRPQLLPSIAGFIDILGFSSMSIAEVDVARSQQLLERIVAAVHNARKFVQDYLATVDTSAAPAGWSVKYFSDNLVLGVPTPGDEAALARSAEFVLRCAQRYQLHMSLSGFFIRGALTHGWLCLTDEIIFGPTLIEAYSLESKTAIVPRILATEPIHRAIESQSKPQADLPGEPQELICRDVDGWWFVNYLDAARSVAGVDWQAIAQHKESIMGALSSTTRHDVLPKFGWACRYHNVFCHWHRNDRGYSDQYRIDRVDEQSTILRMAPPSS